MFALILSVVGPLVLGGGLLTFVPGVGLLAKLATVRGFLKRNPRKVAVAIGILAAIGGFLWHNHKAGAAIEAAEKRGEARAEARHKAALDRITAKAIEIREKAEALSAGISRLQREKFDEDLRRIGALERALLVRGAGRAACSLVGGDPAASAAAGGSLAPGGPRGAPATRVPYPDGFLLGVPHRWAVTTGATCDANRAEALRWREADKDQRAAWERMRAEAKAAEGSAK